MKNNKSLTFRVLECYFYWGKNWENGMNVSYEKRIFASMMFLLLL